jgi:Tfp pilus assembly protein PilF
MVKRSFLVIIFSFYFSYSLFAQNANNGNYIKQEDVNPATRIELQKIGRELINFLRWKKLPLAEKKLIEYEMIQSNTEEYFYLRSAIHFTKKNLNYAEEDLKTTLFINPKHESAFYLIGMVYALWGDWDRSKEAFKMSVSLSPYNPHYYNNLSLVYFTLGDFENAKLNNAKAIDQKNNYSEARLLQIMIDRKLLNNEIALKNAEKFAREEPRNNELKYLLAELIFEFRSDYQRYISLIEREKNAPISTLRYLALSYDRLLNVNRSELIWKEIVDSGLALDEDRKRYLNSLIHLKKYALADKKAQEFLNQNTDQLKDIRNAYISSLQNKFVLEKLYYFFPLN